MSIVKVIEVISEGKSIEEAVDSAVAEAGKSVQNITQLDIDHIHAKIENGKVTRYRIDSKVSFVVQKKAM